MRSSGLFGDALDGVLVLLGLSAAGLVIVVLTVLGLDALDFLGLNLAFKPDDGSASPVFIVSSSTVLKFVIIISKFSKNNIHTLVVICAVRICDTNVVSRSVSSGEESSRQSSDAKGSGAMMSGAAASCSLFPNVNKPSGGDLDQKLHTD